MENLKGYKNLYLKRIYFLEKQVTIQSKIVQLFFMSKLEIITNVCLKKKNVIICVMKYYPFRFL